MSRITDEQARIHALFHLFSKTRQTFESEAFSSRSDLSIGDGKNFYDIQYLNDDDPPLRAFEIISSNKVIGVINIAGSTLLGSTLISVNSVNTEPFNQRAKDIKQILRDHLRLTENELTDENIHSIVYSFPKYGLGVKLDQNEWVVSDWFSGNIFKGNIIIENDDPVQGQLIWSFWDAFPQAGDNLTQWEEENNFISTMFLAHNQPVAPLSAMPDINSTLNMSEANLLSNIKANLSKRPPIQISTSLPVPIIGQVTNVHCAPASLSMIYEYIYGNSLPQNEAANAMDILPNGSTISGQVRGFKKKVGDNFEVELDRTPTWDELAESIKNGLPAKSGIRGHARVAVGIREDIYMNPLNGEIELIEKMLLVNDPEPVGQGSHVWENIKTAQLRDFIFLLRKT